MAYYNYMSCSSCNMRPVVDCGDQCNKSCGCNGGCNGCCGKPILDIDEMPDSVSILRFNMNGLSTWYDFGNLVYQTQTDTNLKINLQKRALIYEAERHTDSILHNELGSILHIADLGDVDITGVTDNSLFVYQKDSDCGEGCEGINNSWIAWNASDNLTDSLKTVMGFDDADKPRALDAPENADQHYTLTWSAADKVKWTQPAVATTAPSVTEDGVEYVYRLYLDQTTKEIVAVKEKK